MAMLARREHSRWELVSKLLAKGYDEAEVEPVVTALIGENLVSDRRFAESLLEVRRARGYGPARIAMELRDRGVDDALVEDVVDFGDPDWVRRLDGLRRRKYGDEAPLQFRELARQMRFYQSRGFTREQIDRVVRPERWDQV